MLVFCTHAFALACIRNKYSSCPLSSSLLCVFAAVAFNVSAREYNILEPAALVPLYSPVCPAKTLPQKRRACCRAAPNPACLAVHSFFTVSVLWLQLYGILFMGFSALSLAVSTRWVHTCMRFMCSACGVWVCMGAMGDSPASKVSLLPGKSPLAVESGTTERGHVYQKETFFFMPVEHRSNPQHSIKRVS
jgi:hypothetical protein